VNEIQTRLLHSFEFRDEGPRAETFELSPGCTSTVVTLRELPFQSEQGNELLKFGESEERPKGVIDTTLSEGMGTGDGLCPQN